MSARSYVVGVPLVVTVSDDGRVTYEVDTSEISSEMSEQFDEDNEDGTTENQMLLDGAIIDAQTDGHQVKAEHPAEWLGAVECPVRYGCKFASSQLFEVEDHIANFDHSDADKF